MTISDIKKKISAGTIQAFVPSGYTADYARLMDSVFGEGACHILSVRKNGACKII